jgi:hypothetical protein
MAAKTKVETNGDAPEEDVTEDKAFRLSITLDPSLRRNIRIAAAYADKTPGEWAAAVLSRAADKALES